MDLVRFEFQQNREDNMNMMIGTHDKIELNRIISVLEERNNITISPYHRDTVVMTCHTYSMASWDRCESITLETFQPILTFIIIITVTFAWAEKFIWTVSVIN